MLVRKQVPLVLVQADMAGGIRSGGNAIRK